MQAAAAGRSDVLDGAGILGLQRAVGNSGVGRHAGRSDGDERSPVHDVVNSGGGSPLAPDVRDEMQGRLGHDFSDVRVHTDSAAHDSAKSVNAHAYTVGSNVVFQRDKYDPSSVEGKTMLAHELTHVVQQRSGPVDGSAAGGGIKVSDPSDRFEREASANADRVMSAPGPGRAAHRRRPAAAVQRHEEEEAIQGAFVQRDEAPEEEEETAQGSFVQREAEEEEAPRRADASRLASAGAPPTIVPLGATRGSASRCPGAVPCPRRGPAEHPAPSDTKFRRRAQQGTRGQDRRTRGPSGRRGDPRELSEPGPQPHRRHRARSGNEPCPRPRPSAHPARL